MARCPRPASAHKRTSKLALERWFENPTKNVSGAWSAACSADCPQDCPALRLKTLRRVAGECYTFSSTEASDCCRFFTALLTSHLFSRQEAFLWTLP